MNWYLAVIVFGAGEASFERKFYLPEYSFGGVENFVNNHMGGGEAPRNIKSISPSTVEAISSEPAELLVFSINGGHGYMAVPDGKTDSEAKASIETILNVPSLIFKAEIVV